MHHCSFQCFFINRFSPNSWSKLTNFALEVDPGFAALTVDNLIVNMLGDVFQYGPNVTNLKVRWKIINLSIIFVGLSVIDTYVSDNINL